MFEELRTSMSKYYPISDETWDLLLPAVSTQQYKKNQPILAEGETAKYIHFIQKGLVRIYYLDKESTAYNKLFFPENTYAASMVSLLTNEPSNFFLETLEDTTTYAIHYSTYRKLLHEQKDLMLFNIYYVEKNWIIKNERRHIDLATEEAKDQYKTFLKEYPGLHNRIAQYHIASYLGITPTQLSRIRKDLTW